jgi:galactose oxidase
MATTNANLITINGVNNTATVEALAQVADARIFGNSVVLPDGTVFIVGGQAFGKPFYDNNSSYTPELWSPITKLFTQLATGPTPRNYHSIALLMPNGTIFVGGGGLCGSCGDRNHFDGQLFSPPYLYKADGVTAAVRPRITAISTKTMEVGSAINVTLAAGTFNNATFSMVRMGSSTHTVNTDQRRVPLTATPGASDTYTIALPGDPGKFLPGYWYLFALYNGTPSTAMIVKVTL